MKLNDVLKVIDDLDMVEISLIDSNNVNKILHDFCYYALKEKHGWLVHELLQRKTIMNHPIYNVIKDYEVFYMTTNTVDYDYTVIRITLKIEEV